jgi:hypothetical protein
MEKMEGKNYLKFYADTPAGDKNKLFTFEIQNLEHAQDLLVKFVKEKGFKVRSAYYVNLKKLSMRIDTITDYDKHISRPGLEAIFKEPLS